MTAPKPEWFPYLVEEVARRILQGIQTPLTTPDTRDLMLKSEEDESLVEMFVDETNNLLRAHGYTEHALVWIKDDDAVFVALNDTPGLVFALLPTNQEYNDEVLAKAFFLVLTFGLNTLVVHDPIGTPALVRARALQGNGAGRFHTTMELELPRIRTAVAQLRTLLLSPLDRADLDMIERLLNRADLLLAGSSRRTHLIARAFVALTPIAHSRDMPLSQLPVGPPRRRDEPKG